MVEQSSRSTTVDSHIRTEWHRNVPTLIDRAFKASERGVSHRPIPFRVGVSALVRDPKSGSLGIIDGANFKPLPGSEGPRKCGEEEVEEKAIEAEVEIIGIVVVAPHQPDDETGLDLGITPCCASCRKRMFVKIIEQLTAQDKKYPISLDTLLLFVNADVPTTRVYMTVRQMFEIFNGVHDPASHAT